MNWLDIVILVLVAVSTFTGLKNGLIKSGLSLIGLLLGIFLAGLYYTTLADKLAFIPNEKAAQIVAFILIMGIVAAVAAVLAAVLTWLTKLITLGWLNNLGGAFFGFVSGAFSVAALLTLWIKFLGPANIVRESSLATILLDRFPAVLALLPEQFDAIRSFFQ